MAFNQKLTAAASAVEQRLADILAAEGSAAPSRLVAAMRHGVLGGGKRFRPFLVVESAALFGVPTAQAIDAAAALECVHCYSLVHDDLPAMDNDLLRRGRPTVWKAFDDWTAILAGDALLTLAFEIVAGPGTHPDGNVRADLAVALARASGSVGMVGGQALDLAADKLGEPAEPTLDHIRRLQAMKTGALIRFACEAGAILGRASADERQSLARYGDHLGFAFQIADDLLDVEGDAGTVGKSTGKDAAAGKATLVSLMGVAEARRKLAEVEAEAVAALAPFGARAQVLADAARFVVARRS